MPAIWHMDKKVSKNSFFKNIFTFPVFSATLLRLKRYNLNYSSLVRIFKNINCFFSEQHKVPVRSGYIVWPGIEFYSNMAFNNCRRHSRSSDVLLSKQMDSQIILKVFFLLFPFNQGKSLQFLENDGSQIHSCPTFYKA